MAEIRDLGFIRHLRAHVVLFRDARLVREGRGLSFSLVPRKVSVAEVPADDRELPLTVAEERLRVVVDG
jgi:hypothetical protein